MSKNIVRGHITGNQELDARLHKLSGQFAYVEFRNGGRFTSVTDGSTINPLDERGNLLPGFRRSARPGLYEVDTLLDPDKTYVVVGVNVETADFSFGPIECGYGETISAAVADAEQRFPNLPDHEALSMIIKRGIDAL
jgi:hypothetical protein